MRRVVRRKFVIATLLLTLALAMRLYSETLYVGKIEISITGNASTGSVKLNIINNTPYTYHDVFLHVYLIAKTTGRIVFSENYTLGKLGFYSEKIVPVHIPRSNSSTLILNYIVTLNTLVSSKVLRGQILLNTQSRKIETELIVNPPPKQVRWAELVYFKGKLVEKNTGKPVSNAEVLLICHDDVLGDTVVKRGRTDSKGYFELTWLAHRTSLTKSYAEVYLKFPGNILYKESRWPTKGYYRITVLEHRIV